MLKREVINKYRKIYEIKIKYRLKINKEKEVKKKRKVISEVMYEYEFE